MAQVRSTTAANVEQQVARICDWYAEELRSCRAPDIDAVVALHPSCADVLRPALHAVRSMLALAPLAATPNAEDVLGDFRLLRVIGSGGMGVVFEAEQLSLRRKVAVKVLPRSERASGMDASLQRFQNEARAAAALDHPSIVPIYAVDSWEGFHFFAMRLIDGCTWRDWIDRSADHATAAPWPPRLDWREAAAKTRDVALALEHAHQRGVIHRDVKPSNLLLDRSNDVWISDFGLATFPAAASLTATGELLGTLRYMSPEQAGAGAVDHRSDIYSLGVTLYELTTGQPTLPVGDRHDQLRHILASSPTAPRQHRPELPNDLETIILKMLAKDPSDRYASAQHVADDLEQLLTGGAIRARRLSRVQQLTRWSRRRAGHLLALTAALAALVMALLGVAAQLQSMRNQALDSQRRAEQAAEGEREAREQESRHRRQLEAAQRQLRAQLRESYAARAEAAVRSGSVGQRFDTLSHVEQAARIPSPPVMEEALRIRLRSLAAAAMSLEDVRPLWQSSGNPHASSLDSMDFHPALSHFTRHVKDEAHVVRVEDEKVVATLPIAGYLMTACFGSQGRALATIVEPESDARVDIWDWRRQETLVTLDRAALGSAPQRWAVDLDDERSRCALGLADGRVVIWSVEDARELQSCAGPGHPAAKVRFSPDGRFVAATYVAPRKLCVWEAESGKLVGERVFGADVFALAWSPDGKAIAAGPGFEIHLVSTEAWDAPPLRVFRGPAEVIAELIFHPSGDLVVSFGYAGKSRLWRCRDGALIQEVSGHANRFSASGDRLAFRSVNHAGIWEVALEDVVWRQRDADTRNLAPKRVAFVSDGGLLAAAGAAGVDLWRISDRRRIGRWTAEGIADLSWMPAKRRLAVASPGGLQFVPLAVIAAGDPGQNTRADSGITRLSVPRGERPAAISASADGAILGVATSEGALAIVLDQKHWIEVARDDVGYSSVAVSHDGRWLAAGRLNQGGFSLWQLDAARRLTPAFASHEEPAGPQEVEISFEPPQVITARESGSVFFAALDFEPRLMTCESTQYGLWRILDSAAPASLGALARPPGYQKGASAWDGGRLLAVAKDRTTTVLADVANFRERLSLVDPVQKAPTAHLTLQPEGHLLACAVAEEGFTVWNLDRIERVLRDLGLE